MKSLFLGMGAAVLFCMTGCETVDRFVYPADDAGLVQVSPEPLSDREVTVLPFEDYRGTGYSDLTQVLFYLPLSPYGWKEVARPDRYGFAFQPGDDLAGAALVSLRRANLFSKVSSADDTEANNAGLFLSGRVLSTTYTERLTAYGLMQGGMALWLLGVPAGNCDNQLVFRMVLHDKSGKVLWNFDYSGSWRQWWGLYYNVNDCRAGYAELTREAMNQAMEQLGAELRENPEKFR